MEKVSALEWEERALAHRPDLERIGTEIAERGSNALKAVVDEANSHGIAMIHTPSGFTFAPQKDGEVLSPQDYEKLPAEERERIAPSAVSASAST